MAVRSGPNGPHEQTEPEIAKAATATGPASNPAKEFVDEIGPTGPAAQEAPPDDSGPNGPH